MGLFSDKKPYTAISSETEVLLAQGSKVDPAKLLNLIELIQVSNPPDAGGKECGRLLRKKLKYGTPAEHVHVISLIETIVDNGVRTGPFVVDSGLQDQLVQLAASHSSRADLSREGKAARHCRSLLHSWAQRSDRNIAGLYSRAGLVDKHERQAFRRSMHVDDDLDEDFADEEEEEAGHSRTHSRSFSFNSHSRHRSHSRHTSRERSPSPINLRGASIEQVIATGHNVSTKLTTSLIADPTGRDGEEYYHQAKQIRRRVIQLIQDPHSDVQALIGELIAANEEIIAALQAYDAVVKNGEPLEEQDDHYPAPVGVNRSVPVPPAAVHEDIFADSPAQPLENPFADPNEQQHHVRPTLL